MPAKAGIQYPPRSQIQLKRRRLLDHPLSRTMTIAKCSHIAVPARDGLADHRGRDFIRDLDVPHLAFPLRGEIGKQLGDYRHIAYLVAARAETACDVFERGPAEHSQAVVQAVGAQLVKLREIGRAS